MTSPARSSASLARAATRHAWAPIVVFLTHVVLSRGFRAYDRWPALDIPMHLLGGVAITHFFRGTLLGWERSRMSVGVDRPLLECFALALTASAAVGWEFLEFLADHAIGTHAQRGLDDTLLGIAGGAAYLAYDRIRRPSA